MGITWYSLSRCIQKGPLLERHIRCLPRLLKKNEGKYAVYSADSREPEVILPTFTAAINEGYKKHGLNDFLTQEISADLLPPSRLARMCFANMPKFMRDRAPLNWFYA
ncbi:MAG TPA: hypothetical protein VJK03_04600 [Candidatus Nanoarchaeia archaeon]|nr:hypothetical protein [Candidatus Nanoarchaeia archaeon]